MVVYKHCIVIQCLSLSHQTIFSVYYLMFCAPLADIQFRYQTAAALDHWVAEMSSKYNDCQPLAATDCYLVETSLKASGCMVSISELSQSILARLTFSNSDIWSEYFGENKN